MRIFTGGFGELTVMLNDFMLRHNNASICPVYTDVYLKITETVMSLKYKRL